MGKASKSATPNSNSNSGKKKGRPSSLDLQVKSRRSTRRNPNSVSGDGDDDLVEDEEEEEEEEFDDDEDEREKKKVKLVVRLPQSGSKRQQNLSSDVNSVSCGSDSVADDPEVKVEIGSAQSEKVSKATPSGSNQRFPLESGPTTPLPDKSVLVFILDRLQKKDTYGVFSEAVDPNELPDYHEIIEHEMHFGLVRNKLDQGLYSNLEELEVDVFLICSNAMQYNSSDTVYYRQAKSIQELAKRDFENLRQQGEDGELRPKVVKRGRPPKHLKKPSDGPPIDRIAPESTSGATLAKVEENATETTPYNLRRGSLQRFQSHDGLFASHRPHSGGNYSESSTDWNNEFPVKILRADMKYGKKNFIIDETRRDTYKQFHPSAFANEPSMFPNFSGDRKLLMPVGLHAEHGYARSLARFAANLGPVAWKIASKRIERALPPGVKFGPGYVGESEPPPRSLFSSSENQNFLQKAATDGLSSLPEIPSTSLVTNNPSFPSKEEIVEEDTRISSQNEFSLQTPQNKPLMHPRNGVNGFYGYNLPSQRLGKVHNGSLESSSLHPGCTSEIAPGTSLDATTIDEASHLGKPSWPNLTVNHKQFSHPDLNVGLQGTGSTGSGLRIGSPQQPDLALQL